LLFAPGCLHSWSKENFYAAAVNKSLMPAAAAAPPAPPAPPRGGGRDPTMIFHRYKAIFFHIGKTAGSSIEQMIAPGTRDPYLANRHEMYGFDEKLNIYLHHASCRTTRDIVDAEIFDSYFKFAIVRNPYTRMISAYYYLYDQNRELYGDFKDFIMALPELAAHPEKLRGSHQISQLHYTHLDGAQVADYIGRFEQLDVCIAEINARLGLEATLPTVNATQHPDYPARDKGAAYDDEMIAVMRNVYADDFTVYGYGDAPPRA